MQINIIGANEKIINIVSSMNSNPDSWKGWSALQIEAGEELSEQEFSDAALSVKAILGSYLHDVEGTAFFCNNQYIYMVCKAPPSAVLDQAGAQISELVFKEIYLSAKYHVYDLGTEGPTFAKNVLGNLNVEYTNHVESELDDALNVGVHTKVLLVEDDAVIRWMVRNSLKDECDFASAPTAHNVFSMYSSFKPDIIFLDIGLPDNSGDKVLEWIMRHDPEACVVMLSGKDNIENITECIEKGAKGFIPKPFIKENLLHYIRAYGSAA